MVPGADHDTTDRGSFVVLDFPASQLAERAGKIAQMNGVDLSTHAVPRGEAINREIDLISVRLLA